MQWRALAANLLGGLTAPDPGLIRLEQAAKGALAMLSAGVVAYGVIAVFAGRRLGDAAFFATIACFMSFLILVQGPPAARRRAAVLAVLPFAAGVALSALLADWTWLRYLTLLGLMFLAFYVRRFGAGPAGLAMIATLAFYIALALSVSTDLLGWYELAAVIGMLSSFVWQFLLWPYRPDRYLQRAVAAFERKVGAAVDVLIGELKAGAGGGADAAASMQRRLHDVGATRRVIEEQFAAVVSPARWTQQRLNQLRLQLYEIEQGLERMALGAAELARRTTREPEALPAALVGALTALQRVLSGGASGATTEAMTELASKRDELETAARSAAGSDTSGSWGLPVLQVAAGGSEVGRGVQAVRALDTPSAASTGPAEQQEPAALTRPVPLLPVLGRFHLPPTTVLALQALLSAGLAMLVSTVLDLDHPWWAFWSAFIVIAGASSESRRKLGMRVAGTIIGAFIGTLIAVIAPETVGVLLVLITAAMAMAIYVRAVSYTWMVFWIVVFLAVMFGAEGDVWRILIVRPINVAIGAVIAALVVTYVLPIPLAGRFRAALGSFLAATDRYIGALIATAVGRAGTEGSPPSGGLGAEATAGTMRRRPAGVPQFEESPALDEAQLGADETYEALAETFPSASFDYNPFSQAQSPLTAQGTTAAALRADTDRLAAEISADAPPLDAGTAQVITAIQSSIHDNLAIVQGLATGHPQGQVRSLADTGSGLGAPPLLGADPTATDTDAATYGRGVLDDLARIQRSVVRLAEELGAHAEPQPARGTPVAGTAATV